MLKGLVTTINRGKMLEYKHIPAAFQFFYPGGAREDIPEDCPTPVENWSSLSRCHLR